MRKINHNTSLITESELNSLITNIVRQQLQEEQLDEISLRGVGDKISHGLGKTGKKLAKAGLIGTIGATTAIGALNSPTADEEWENNHDAHEMNKTVRDFSHSDKGTPVHSDSTKIRPMESVHLTPSQFQQVIRESVCRILQEQGVNILSEDMDEGVWQNIKAAGKAILDRKKGGSLKDRYNTEMYKYEKQNADEVARQQKEDYRKMYNDALKKYQETIANGGDKDKALEDFKNATTLQYNKYNAQRQNILDRATMRKNNVKNQKWFDGATSGYSYGNEAFLGGKQLDDDPSQYAQYQQQPNNNNLQTQLQTLEAENQQLRARLQQYEGGIEDTN